MLGAVVMACALFEGNAGGEPPPKLINDILPLDDVMDLPAMPVIAVEAAEAMNIALVRRMVAAELKFVRHVCELPPTRRHEFRERADVVTEEVFKRVKRSSEGSGVVDLKIRSLIQESFTREIRRISADQAQIYEREASLRNQSLKEAVILDLASKVDAELGLSMEQRAGITTALTAKWRIEWEHWLMALENEELIVPDFADTIVYKLLTPSQKKVWKSIPKFEILAAFEDFGWDVLEEGVDEDPEIGDDESYWRGENLTPASQ